MRWILFLPYFFIFLHSAKGQISEKFDSISQNISQAGIGNDIDQALNQTDYLLKIAITEEEQISALMLKSKILRQKGDRNSSVAAALQAEKLAFENDLYNWHARICGFLSTQYRENGIEQQGKEYLAKALISSKKITDKNQSLSFQGNLHQELAYYEMDKKNHQVALEYLKSGNRFFQKIESLEQRNFHLAVNAELIGKNYIFLDELDSARNYYFRGLEFLSQSAFKESPLKGFIFNGLGNIYFIENNIKKAEHYFGQAIKIAEDSEFEALQFELYQSLLNFYKTTGNADKYIVYNEKYIELQANHNEVNKLSVNLVVQNLHEKNRLAEKRQFYIIIISLSSLIIIIVITYLFFRKKRKRDYARFKLILEEAKKRNQETKPLKETKPKTVQEKTANYDKEFLPKETEEKLLQGLKRFEKSTKFLEKTISLPVLAGRLATNTKYLSHVINKHKKKDFSSYINELRIYYIVKKLENDPQYLNYKISYLADECGFSSHSKFTTTFKNVTGMSPSKFLEYLGEEKQKNADYGIKSF